MSRKFDALICALIVALTVVVPAIGYHRAGELFAQQGKQSRESAERSRQLAADTEAGKIKPDPAGFPTYLRMEATARSSLADMYFYLGEASRNLLSAVIGVAIAQAGLLGWLLRRSRSRDITGPSSRSPSASAEVQR